MATTTKERLASIRDRLARLRTERKEVHDTLKIAEKGGDSDMIAAVQARLTRVEGELEDAKRLESVVLAEMAGVSRTPGSTLLYNPEAQARLAEIAESTAPLRGNVHIGSFMSAEEVAGLSGGMLAVAGVPDSGGRVGWAGIAAPPNVPTTLLDFFESVPMEQRRIDFLRRDGVADAAIQTAGSVKHQASLEYTAASSRAITVASWSKANKQDLADVDALAEDIRQTLSYGVRVEVERLLLNGAPADDDGEAVAGLLSVTFAPTITATNLADAIGQARAQLRARGVQPNYAAANAATVEEEAERTGTDGHYVNTISDDGRIRRLPLIESEALDDGEVIVGDSRIAAKLGVRSGINVLLSDSDQDDFVRNRVTVLAEGRFTPLVAVPTATGHFELS